MTAATAPAPVLPAPMSDEIEARWDAATARVIEQRREDGATIYTRAMCKDWLRIERSVKEWATLVYGDHLWADEDLDALDDLTGDLYDHIRREVVAFAAQRITTHRAARVAGS